MRFDPQRVLSGVDLRRSTAAPAARDSVERRGLAAGLPLGSHLKDVQRNEFGEE